jgi:ankyrin repeat protein
LASTKDTLITELLLDINASAGYRADQEGMLPIHVAAANGSLEIVELLSERCPNCSWSCNNLGQTILHIAVEKRRYNVVKYVCSEEKFKPILNIRDTNGNTALHLAVLQGNQFIFCQFMRTREVYLSLTNKEARTPLDLAQLSLPPPALSLHPVSDLLMMDLIFRLVDQLYIVAFQSNFDKSVSYECF